MKYYKYIRIVLILIPVIVLGCLVHKDISPSGYLKVDYDFCREDPFISKFSPMGRVLEIERDRGECSQIMVIDPVYFDVRLPQSFSQAKLKVWYMKSDGVELKIGPRFNRNEWQWLLQDIEYTGEEDGWMMGETEYDLSYISLDRNRIRFLISSAGLDKMNEEIKFKRVEIEFFKQPLNKDNFIPRLKSLFNL